MFDMLQTARPRTTTADDQAAFVETEERLVARYSSERCAPDEVRAAVDEAVDRLAGARIRAFLPILVERSVRLRLGVA